MSEINHYIPPEIKRENPTENVENREERQGLELLSQTLREQGYAFLHMPDEETRELLLIYTHDDRVDNDGRMLDKKAIESKTLDLLEKFHIDGQDWYLPIAVKGWITKEKNGQKTIDDNRTYRLNNKQQQLQLPVESGQEVDAATVNHHSFNGVEVDTISALRKELEWSIANDSEQTHGLPTEILEKILATVPKDSEPWIKKGVGTLLTGIMFQIERQEETTHIDTDALHMTSQGEALETSVGIKPKTGVQAIDELNWPKINHVAAKFNLSEVDQKNRIAQEQQKIQALKIRAEEEQARYWEMMQKQWADETEGESSEDERAQERTEIVEQQLRPEKPTLKARLRRWFLGEN